MTGRRQKYGQGHQIGFTMIEVVITIAVVAILAAVLVPLISQNIESARNARATSDVATLGKAMVQFYQDTARWPIYNNTTAMRLVFSDVDNNNDGIPDNSAIPSGWDTVPAANRLTLAHHLIAFNMGPLNISTGPQPPGTPAWNGPYLSEVRPDPWGNAYVVNVQWLWDTSGGVNSVYVLSAGDSRPATVETPFNGNPPANSDDIVYRIQ
jgi:prepilin-type N-terminal cleavage/methylation domain-containing protein